jgi:glycosyltransferase involved in cell wall biosynthesis
MNSLPKLSVLMITYNHERFIEQAVRSALMQKTAFAYEIVIGEDRSTDRTREILRRLDAEHPGRLRLFLREQNLGMVTNFRETYAACTGEYIALLEGDDYWTDPHKLDRQMAALTARPDWSACFHPARHVNESGDDLHSVHPLHAPSEVTLSDLFKQNLIQTCTVVLDRRRVPAIPEWFQDLRVGDWPLFILLAKTGPIGFLPDAMACYRLHPASAWSSRPYHERLYETLRMFWVLENRLGQEANGRCKGAGQVFLAQELSAREQQHRAELNIARRGALLSRLARFLAKRYAAITRIISGESQY